MLVHWYEAFSSLLLFQLLTSTFSYFVAGLVRLVLDLHFINRLRYSASPFVSFTQTDRQFLPQFSLGFFFFVDASAYSHSSKNGSIVHINFVDWIPCICSALGMLVINSIEKSRLSADSYSYSGTGVAWKAQLVLFLGFALMAGGLAGSVVSDIFVIA